MTTATDRFLALLSGVRPRGQDRWIARCAGHDDHSPSLSIRRIRDRLLIRCWAGCTAEQIVAAMGLTLADLYDRRGQYRPSNPIVNRRRYAVAALEAWRQAEFRLCAEDLRSRDTLAGAITVMVQAGEITEAEAWDSLAAVYRGYSALEYRFRRLLHNRDVFALWRESRRSAA